MKDWKDALPAPPWLLPAPRVLAVAQVESITTPPAGSVWNNMASVIAAEARKTRGGRLVVQPYGGNAQMMEAADSGLAEYSLN